MASGDLKTAAAATAVAKQDGPTVFDLIKRQEAAIARALPSHITPERFARVALTEVRRTPKLQECTVPSLLGGLMQAAQLGLELGPLGLAYLVPFKNKGRLEAQLIIGYKGIIDLARRSGNIESIIARDVYENDEFTVDYGLEDRLIHKPNLDGDRGETVAYYAIAKYVGGGHTFWVMTKPEIDARRARSTAKDSGPWVTDYDAMARKTVIRAMAAYLPLTTEAAEAIATDENTFRFDPDDGVIEAEIVEDPPAGLDPVTGELPQ